MAAGVEAARGQFVRGAAGPIGQLMLSRIAAEGGATRTELQRDLAPFFSHKLAPADWRRLAETQAGVLIAGGLARETRSRMSASDEGLAEAERFLGLSVGARPWAELRDLWLVAKVLGISDEPAAKLKALLGQDSLRGLIVQKSFGLPLKKNQPVAKIRAQLAIIALERAFGNKIKAGFSQRDALPGKAGRLLAGQLSSSPRDFGTDARLIAELAAEQAGAKDSDTESLRAALLQRLGSRLLEDLEGVRAPLAVSASPLSVPVAANDAGPAEARPPSVRPDLSEFARKVQGAAATCSEGWPGNRKAYISRVWSAIRASEPQWALSEIEFKCMLAEAHRAGRVVLANADLKDKRNLEELESSAVLYKNTAWHFVRVEE
jgi:hypothetical protein